MESGKEAMVTKNAAEVMDDFCAAWKRLYGAEPREPICDFPVPMSIAMDRVFDTGPYPFVPIPYQATPESATPRNPTVEIEQQGNGTTVLHIDKRQVRVSTKAESEDKLEILLEPRQQT